MLDVKGDERGKEAGGITVVILGVILVVLLLFLGAITLVSAVTAKQKAQGAADILAIESAKAYFSKSVVHDGHDTPHVCPGREKVKVRFGVILEDCAVNERGDVLIAVSVETPLFPQRIQAIAVAGEAKS